MSKFIYFEQFKNKREQDKQNQIKIRNKTILKVVASIVFVVWIIAYFALFMTKGIYVNDNFYKKQPNIKDISYTAVSQKSLPKKIILNKNINNTATLTIDGNIVYVNEIKTNFEGDIESFTVEGYNSNSDVYGIKYEDIGRIVTQQLERNRGNMVYFIIVILLIAISIILKYNSTKIFTFINKKKTPTDTYYKFCDNSMWFVVVLGVLFLTFTL